MVDWVRREDAQGIETYIVFAIGLTTDCREYLHRPQMMAGWEYARMLPGCYAALLMPKWPGSEGLVLKNSHQPLQEPGAGPSEPEQIWEMEHNALADELGEIYGEDDGEQD